MEKKHVTIVVPVFNEEENIPLLYDKLCEVLKPLDYKWNLLFVNDGSNDHSLLMMRRLMKKDERVQIINFSRNFGHQAALTAGLDHAQGDVVISMDCDLQDPPEMIPEMLQKWEEGNEVVLMRRKVRKDRFFKRLSASIYYKLLYRFSELKIKGEIADFRLLDRSVLDELKQLREKTRYLRGMVAWLGFEYCIIEYVRPNRIKGKTGFSVLSMIRFGMSGILNFSLIPLRLGLVLGIITIPIGLFFLIYMVIDILVNNEVYLLYKWLSIVNFMFTGFLFILLWILAEYIGKIYNEAKGRPIYVVKKIENLPVEQDADKISIKTIEE